LSNLRKLQSPHQNQNQKAMNKIWLLDAGHGGVTPGGVYTTDPNFDPSKPGPGRKCYAHPDGTYVLEGQFNRAVRSEIIQLLVHDDSNMRWKTINYGSEDMSLNDRVEYANEIHAKHGDCVYLSIHGNAGGGKGFEVYTSVGETESDKIADVWIDEMVKVFPGKVDRGEKDRNFQVIRYTHCPAILTESFFMDTLEDAKIMSSMEGIKKVALAHFNMMKRVDAGEHLS